MLNQMLLLELRNFEHHTALHYRLKPRGFDENTHGMITQPQTPELMCRALLLPVTFAPRKKKLQLV